MMVLSYALAKRSGTDFESLLRTRLLSPLGMSDTYIAKLPPNVRVAQGHLSNGMPAGPWDFHVDMAGGGGVRATLPDMVRYLEGRLGTRESQITPALARTQQQSSPSLARRNAPSSCSATRHSPIWAGSVCSGCTCSIPPCPPARRAPSRLPTSNCLTRSLAVIACATASAWSYLTKATR